MSQARWPILLAVICIGLYSNSLNNSFHYDDVHSIVNNINLWKSASVADFGAKIVRFCEDPGMFSVDPNKGMYRPVLLVTYLLNFQFGDNSVWGFHVVNLLVHTLNVILVYWLCLLLIGRPGSARMASLLFAVHPLCTEPVNYISSRSDSLSALFYLLGICLFVWGRSGGERRRTWQSFGAAGALALGLLSKSTVITLPAVLLLYDFLHSGRTLSALKKKWWKNHAPLWLVSGCYLLIIMQNQFLPRSLGNPVRSSGSQFLTQIKAVVYYVQQLVLPSHLTVEPQFSEGTISSAGVVGCALLLVTSLAILLWRRYASASSLTLFLILWPLIAMLPVIVMPLNVFVNERRLYLPCVAFCIGLAIAFSFVRQRRLQIVPGLNLLAVLLLICFGTLVIQRNPVWADDTSLWKDAVAKAPLMPRNHLYLGNVHKDLALAASIAAEETRHWDAALDSYQRVIALGRDEELALRALNNQGSVYFSLGDMEAAERVYRESLRINPLYADALINMGNVLVMRSRPVDSEEKRARVREAMVFFKKALEVSPNDKNAYGSLGVAYHDLADFDMAIKTYKRALALDPWSPKNWKNLGGVHFQLGKTAIVESGSELQVVRRARKDLQKALAYYKKSLEYSPHYADAALGRDQVGELLRQVDEFLLQRDAQKK
jgi:tetratricopeptide (TPR) repeat protein